MAVAELVVPGGDCAELLAPVHQAFYGYELVNYHSGKCLDIYHSSTANFANVDVWTCNLSAAQLWEEIAA